MDYLKSVKLEPNLKTNALKIVVQIEWLNRRKLKAKPQMREFFEWN